MFTKALPFVALIASVVLLVTVGCGGGSSPDDTANRRDPEPPKKAEPVAAADAPKKAAAPKAPTGGEPYDAAKATATIKGVVSFDGKPQSMLNLSIDKHCADNRVAMGLAPLKDDSLLVNADGKVANVFVYVSEGYQKYDFSNFNVKAARVNQVGCQYTPHAFGMKVGQLLEIESSDPIAHNVHGTPSESPEFNLPQPQKGILATMPSFASAEMNVTVKCEVHGWMNARICVFDHVFFAVTKEDGSYELKVPPGKYTVSAWQEKQIPFNQPKKWKFVMSGEKKDLEVKAEAPAVVDFTYKAK